MNAKRMAVAAAVVVVTGAGFAAFGRASTGPASIRITDLQLSDRHFGKGIGSREIVRANLYERGGDKHWLGRSAMTCTYVTATQRSCTTIFTLPRGTIVVTGVLTSRLLYELAIVGGTGLYDNARGTLTTTVIKLRPRRDLLLFRLTG